MPLSSVSPCPHHTGASLHARSYANHHLSGPAFFRLVFYFTGKIEALHQFPWFPDHPTSLTSFCPFSPFVFQFCCCVSLVSALQDVPSAIIPPLFSVFNYPSWQAPPTLHTHHVRLLKFLQSQNKTDSLPSTLCPPPNISDLLFPRGESLSKSTLYLQDYSGPSPPSYSLQSGFHPQTRS